LNDFMKTREVNKFLRREILPCQKGWQVTGGILHLSGPSEVLRGVCIEASGFASQAVYVWAFAMPMYVPAEEINFLFGKRLRDGNGSERWSVDAENPKIFASELLAVLEREGMPWLHRFESLDSIVKFINEMPQESINIHHRQILAYSLAYQGKVGTAVKLLTALAAEADEIESTSPWAKPISERARHLVRLENNAPETVQATLSNWVNETRRFLKLPFRGVGSEGAARDGVDPA
jgi:hypothetical protein